MSVSAWSNSSFIDTLPTTPGTTSPTYEARTKSVTVNATGLGDGSRSSPWTLQQAMSQAVAGDVVGIEAGTYVGTSQAGNDTEKRYTPAFYPRNSGTSSNYITFVAQYPATGSGPYSDIRSGATEDSTAADSSGGWPAFGTRSCNYIHFIGLYSNGGDYNNMQTRDAAPCSMWWTTGSIVEHCRVLGGLNVYNDGTRNYSAVRMEHNYDVVIRDSIFEDFGPTEGNSAAVIFYSARNYLIEHNTIRNCTFGLQYKGGGQVDELYGATQFNLIEDCYDAMHTHAITDGPQGQRCTWTQNLMIDCDSFFYCTSGGAAATTLNDADVTNNTFVNGNDSLAMFFWNVMGSSKTNIFKNNIYSGINHYTGGYGGTVGTIANQAEHDYNCIHNVAAEFIKYPTTTALSTWQNQYTEDVNSITSDPQFVGGGDYRLQAGSPCRTASSIGGPQGCYITGDEVIGVRYQ